VVWIPYADDDQQRFDELAALYLICRKRLQEINIETKMVASPGSVAHRDEQTLLSHDPPVPDSARHLITFTAQSYLHAASEHMGSDLSATAALAATNQDSAALLVQIGFGQTERLADPQPGAPEQDDQRTEPVTVGTVASPAHHRDDLVDRRRVSRIAKPLVARRSPVVIAWHRRRGAATTGSVQQHRFQQRRRSALARRLGGARR
jgi:hypothetical protein